MSRKSRTGEYPRSETTSVKVASEHPVSSRWDTFLESISVRRTPGEAELTQTLPRSKFRRYTGAGTGVLWVKTVLGLACVGFILYGSNRLFRRALVWRDRHEHQVYEVQVNDFFRRQQMKRYVDTYGDSKD